MKKHQQTFITWGLIFVFFLIIGNVTSGNAASNQVVIVSWGGAWEEAAKKAFGEPFEKETGIKVVFTGPPDMGKLKAMVQSSNVEWDIGQTHFAQINRMSGQNLLEPIDYSVVDKSMLMPNTWQKYGCGGQFEAVIVGYRTDAFKGGGPRGWKDFWDVKTFPGPRSLRKNAWYTMEAALLADGVPPDKLYPFDENRAFASLEKIKPHVATWWWLGSQTQVLLTSREADMTSAWNARVTQLILQGQPIGISWDQGIYYCSAWYVLKNAPHKKEAMRFINFSNRANNQAEMAIATPYGPTNPEALKFMPENIQKLMPTHPDNLPKLVLLNADYWSKNEERLVEKFNNWMTK